MHTHINAEKKEKAIDRAVGQRRLLYAEVHTANVCGIVDVNTAFDLLSEFKFNVKRPEYALLYCSAECAILFHEKQARQQIFIEYDNESAWFARTLEKATRAVAAEQEAKARETARVEAAKVK